MYATAARDFSFQATCAPAWAGAAHTKAFYASGSVGNQHWPGIAGVWYNPFALCQMFVVIFKKSLRKIFFPEKISVFKKKYFI